MTTVNCTLYHIKYLTKKIEMKTVEYHAKNIFSFYFNNFIAKFLIVIF